MESSHQCLSLQWQRSSEEGVIRISTSLQSCREARISPHLFAALSPPLARQLDQRKMLPSIKSCVNGHEKWRGSLLEIRLIICLSIELQDNHGQMFCSGRKPGLETTRTRVVPVCTGAVVQETHRITTCLCDRRYVTLQLQVEHTLLPEAYGHRSWDPKLRLILLRRRPQNLRRSPDLAIGSSGKSALGERQHQQNLP